MQLNFVGQRVPQSRLTGIWSEFYGDKPFPSVKAYILENRVFRVILRRLLTESPIHNGLINEYGEDIIDVNQTNAVLFKSTEGLMILIARWRDKPLEDVIRHELKHIYDGDYKIE